MDGAMMNSLLRRQWPRVSYSDFGYKLFGTFIQDGCGLSIYHPPKPQTERLGQALPGSGGREEAMDREPYVPAVQHQHNQADATDGAQSPLPPNEASNLHAALEGVSPQITYPTLDALENVLLELTLQMTAKAPEALLDLVGNELPEVSAEQILHAFSLLYTVGAFREQESDGAIALSSDIASVEDGVKLVLQDAERRAETVGVEISGMSMHEALFSGA